MEWMKLTQEDYITTQWSGGTTTQLSIEPDGADYAKRDFLWRLSSAEVALEHSDFTPLPDYNRLLSVLRGKIDLKVGDSSPEPLALGQVCAFDGGVPVESWGTCTDFNLMVRKGVCSGLVQYLELKQGGSMIWTMPVLTPEEGGIHALALYCITGDLSMEQEGTIQQGHCFLCRDAIAQSLYLNSESGCKVLVAVVHRKEAGR